MLRAEPITREPLNAHTPHEAFAQALTPTEALFVRNHFPVPRIPRPDWRLRVAGVVERGRTLAWGDLLALPQHETTIVLECAGNGRTLMDPVPSGTPWGDRAVGCARFRGARVRDVLEAAGLSPGAAEVVFAGADAGAIRGREARYERSLPLPEALAEDVLLAHEMNGAPLAPEHGAPVRLVAPGWYGFASVKWLVEMRVVDSAFTGHFQADDYWIRDSRDGAHDRPVTRMRVKSLVTSPAPDAVLEAGGAAVARGWAWSGRGEIAHVDVSFDGGASWRRARLDGSEGPHAWRAWSIDWVPGTGEHVVVARATDTSGDTQPLMAPWNRQGYENNVAPCVRVRAR